MVTPHQPYIVKPTTYDVVVKNGGSLKLMHTDKTVLEKGFKVEVGGKLIIKQQQLLGGN